MDTAIIVAIIAAIATIVAAMIAGIFTILKRDKPSQPSQSFKVKGGGNAVAAGGNVYIGDRIETHPHSPSRLEITDVGFTYDAEIDLKIRNLGDDSLIINKISILMVRDYNICALPVLNPTARYTLRVDGMNEGQTRNLNISHYVDAHKADRILIATDTTCRYRLLVTLHYNQNETVSCEIDTC